MFHSLVCHVSRKVFRGGNDIKGKKIFYYRAKEISYTVYERTAKLFVAPTFSFLERKFIENEK